MVEANPRGAAKATFMHAANRRAQWATQFHQTAMLESQEASMEVVLAS